MDVRGLHGVTKELLIKPGAEGPEPPGGLAAVGLGAGRKDPLGDPAAALSAAVRAAREQAQAGVSGGSSAGVEKSRRRT